MSKITEKFPGSKILLVDDYFINQELAKDLLEIMECTVDIAEDGEEAITKYQETDYNAIIMDIQMPVKDGYQATREIRELEKSNGKHVPIIAITANALQGDDQKCYDAGMDAYISKPLDPKKLEEILKKFLTKKAST